MNYAMYWKNPTRKWHRVIKNLALLGKSKPIFFIAFIVKIGKKAQNMA